MPDLFDCLQSAIDANMVPRRAAQSAQAEFREIVAQLESHYPPAAARALAAQRLRDAAARGAQARRHTVLAQLQTAQRNQAIIGSARDPGTALIELVEGKEGTGNTFESVRFIRDSYRRQFMGMIREALAAHGTDILGRVRNRARLMDLVRELHGQASGNPEAARMAAAVRGAQIRARSLFNAHGGDIGELADFGLPHSHDTRAIRAAGFDAWRAEVAPRLDWARIEDAATGRPFAAPGQMPPAAVAERFLRDVFEGITTRNWDERMPSMAAGGVALMNRRADHRVLHFRDADAWMAYNERFGASNPFQAMVTHLEGMARDIALMRVLGPNPKAGLEHAIQIAQRRASTAGDARAENLVSRRADRAKAMLAAASGSGSVPADETWGRFLAGTRNVLTSAQLGGAMLSAASDIWTSRMAAKAVGMNPRSLFMRRMALITSGATRETAAQMGYVADTLANAGSASARYLGDVWSPEITSRLADTVLRASGLSFWTDMNRLSFQMEFSGHLASQAHLAFGDIDAPLRRTLEGRGITAADWDALRDPAAMFTAPNGARFIAPMHWVEATALPRAQAEALAARLGAIIEEQMEFAVPSVSLEGRSMFLGNTAPGTFIGELARSGLMYKSYGLSVMLGQIRRVQAQPSGLARAAYVAQFVAGLTAFGALSVQLKQMASGRDPRPMDDATFWGAAFLQGGGVGIFGDFLTSETSRTGGGLAETIAGPVVGLAGDALRFGGANVASAVAGRDTHFGRDAVQFLRRNTPGTNLWQTRVALDRLVWDQLQALLDPKAAQAWAQQESARTRINHNRTWWERGAGAPARAPDLAAAMGGPQ